MVYELTYTVNSAYEIFFGFDTKLINIRMKKKLFFRFFSKYL